VRLPVLLTLSAYVMTVPATPLPDRPLLTAKAGFVTPPAPKQSCYSRLIEIGGIVAGNLRSVDETRRPLAPWT